MSISGVSMNFAPPQQRADRASSPHASGAAVAGATPSSHSTSNASSGSDIDTSALDLTLRDLRPLLTEDVTDLCINSPREAFVDTSSGWHREALPFADYHWCHRLAKLVAHA